MGAGNETGKRSARKWQCLRYGRLYDPDQERFVPYLLGCFFSLKFTATPKREIQAALMAEERSKNKGLGLSDWLARGIEIQETQ